MDVIVMVTVIMVSIVGAIVSTFSVVLVLMVMVMLL
jgi:hypothetical protein